MSDEGIAASLRADATKDQLQRYGRSAGGDRIDRDDPPMDHHHMPSVREFEHRGRQVVIRTTYEVTIDGEPLTGHFGVDRDGSVHYHGMPQASFGSAVDMVKRIVDVIDSQDTARSEGKGY